MKTELIGTSLKGTHQLALNYLKKLGFYDNDISNGGNGFGIIQWTDASRKTGLLKSSEELKNSGVYDLRSQLAFFRYEMTEGDYKSSWSKVKSSSSATATSDIFLREIEMPRDISTQTPIRRSYATSIYGVLA